MILLALYLAFLVVVVVRLDRRLRSAQAAREAAFLRARIFGA